MLNAPRVGEFGTLTVSADKYDWSGSEDVEIEKEGENYAEVKVSYWPQFLHNKTLKSADMNHYDLPVAACILCLVIMKLTKH